MRKRAEFCQCSITWAKDKSSACSLIWNLSVVLKLLFISDAFHMFKYSLDSRIKAWSGQSDMGGNADDADDADFRGSFSPAANRNRNEALILVSCLRRRRKPISENPRRLRRPRYHPGHFGKYFYPIYFKPSGPHPQYPINFCNFSTNRPTGKNCFSKEVANGIGVSSAASRINGESRYSNKCSEM